MESKQADIQALEHRAYKIRRNALRMGQVQGQGYIAQALGFSDVLAVCYFHALNYQADNPEWEGRDRLYLSIGHYAIALYAAMIEADILPENELETYGCDDSRMPMSGMAAYTPGMEITGGSLGHGLGIAVGAALGLKRKQSESFIYNLLSDGELGEGSTWEAAMSASHHKLDNIIAVVDFNNQQADGPSQDMLCSEPLDDKWRAFGWHVQRIDGNDLSEVIKAFDTARNLDAAQPRVIICNTKMAKGVPFLEQRERNHFLRVEADEWDKAIEILDAGRA
ncbi:putative Transketolase, N-terminal section [Vibrio nigripulchritudo MADA3029]|uniref:Transketolase, N-terminal section n=2 Tax=Vibrio nigripulchritudo TaxID=28173 RepID=A0AAV2VRQ6_9VIBR|nr:transketolase [Vibrio nigripulchritudo]EGU55236.1 transketolase [Vibrio nigripulchritudo ATCC 27043]KJY80512.1 transketolase [Vibrio nigripulchritudo]CCN50165.1 putative Transketolase, N-terminal section [Vibrio nigripulchritudo MADA3020]CCN55408.1 putative Transketolase, N-terminal section [Vibrio nigripulchritudo MADA3021]CCN57205.1 putative Transketolase, N-terminal section [Vibrio nigripulchritudo MADA3029]